MRAPRTAHPDVPRTGYPYRAATGAAGQAMRLVWSCGKRDGPRGAPWPVLHERLAGSAALTLRKGLLDADGNRYGG